MRRELLVLDEIIAAAERASTIAAECSVDELGTDINARDALLWNMTIIGEACSQLPGSLRAGFPEIEWRRAIGLRNRIVHGYWGIDLSIVHTAASAALPDFLRGVRSVRDAVENNEA